jgi:hypothetical protein
MLRIDLLLALGLLLAVPAFFRPTQRTGQEAPKVDLSKIGRSQARRGRSAALDRLRRRRRRGKTAAPQPEKLLKRGSSTKVAVRA